MIWALQVRYIKIHFTPFGQNDHQSINHGLGWRVKGQAGEFGGKRSPAGGDSVGSTRLQRGGRREPSQTLEHR